VCIAFLREITRNGSEFENLIRIFDNFLNVMVNNFILLVGLWFIGLKMGYSMRTVNDEE
jgi:hypothetical protein